MHMTFWLLRCELSRAFHLKNINFPPHSEPCLDFHAMLLDLEDFRIDMAGSNAGTMYGKGCYLAENCFSVSRWGLAVKG